MTREEDFAEASTQFDGIYAQVAFSTGCEHGYQYALQHPQWISVEETPFPPKKNKWDKKIEVLVYGLWMGRPTILFGTYHYDTNEWGANGLISDITHWMPIPQPPQGKEQDYGR